MNSSRVTVGVPTKNRYDTLVLTLQALAFQTFKEFDIIIVDDSDEPKDLRELPAYRSVFELFNRYGIGWRVIYGRKLGQNYSHQIVQDEAQTEWIFRVDDDEIPEPTVLQILLDHVANNVGAIGGLVPQGALIDPPPNAGNFIEDLSRPNLQWFRLNHPSRVYTPEHLHSTFLYRKGIAKYELSLSPAAHREETIFTHEIYRAGYKLLVAPNAITWHFRNEQGGIRSHQNPAFWSQDEQIFNERLLEWGIKTEQPKPIVLDSGKGDHVIVKKLLPELKSKYGNLILATCFRDVFDPEPQISIAEAYQRFGDLSRFNIYRWMIEQNWKGSIESAYRKLFKLDDPVCTVREEATERVIEPEELPVLQGAFANA